MKPLVYKIHIKMFFMKVSVKVKNGGAIPSTPTYVFMA
jgi:hypothetical protein